ncbi:hypothetical protein PG999_005523 [Apiospora kogelbergensis]|uniref:CorA-like Mg2+ transporter protein n=1 Tax=Apiospora kogelbergensis TaxID=1337665 RepID=A0AAW0R2J9_9PEZI
MGSFEQARRVPTGDSKASRDSCCRRHSGNISKPTPGLLLIAGLTIRLPECAKDYAETVREFSRLSSFKSLYSGPRFLSLGDFLWRPYEHRATTTRYRPTTAAHQFEPFPFLMVLNWQEGPEKRIQQLSTVDQLQTVDKSTANLVVLKGYPTAEWLNALGAKFRIDPDFYQRHLCFWSESGNNTSRRNMAPRLPSVQAETIGLRIPTIGKLTGRKQPTHRDAVLENLEHIRRQTSQRMTAYISQLSTLESPDMDVAYSIVREFVMLDANHFAIEQIISISIVANRNGGWTSTVWSDVGRSLDEGLDGPWRPKTPKLDHSEIIFQPISIFKPRIALERGRRSRHDSAPHAQHQSASILFEEYDQHLDSAQAAIDPLYSLSPIFKFALYSEVALLDIIESNVRSEIAHSAVTAQESPTMSNLPYTRPILKRHIDSLRETIAFVEGFMKRPAYQAVINNPINQGAGEMASVLEDFRAALRRAEGLCDECFEGIGIVAHNATLQESQKAFAEARSVTKLTKLALVFVPLSFTTSAFGMNIKELGDADAPSIWVWTVITMAMAIIVYAFFRWDTTQMRAFAGVLLSRR